MVFSPGEWRLDKATSKVLEISLRVTKAWEGKKYPTMNLVCSEIYEMKKKLKGFTSSSCNYASQFATVLSSKVEKRFPNCEANNATPAIANYIDPAFKGVHIEAIGSMQVTKEKIKRIWRFLDDEKPRQKNDQDFHAEENETQDLVIDSTAQLLRAKKMSGD